MEVWVPLGGPPKRQSVLSSGQTVECGPILSPAMDVETEEAAGSGGGDPPPAATEVDAIPGPPPIAGIGTG
jgi:hypothetical protein